MCVGAVLTRIMMLQHVQCAIERQITKGNFLFSSFVPNMFPSSSQWVPNMFPLGSQHVPFKFPLGSYRVPNMFPSSSQWVPIKFPTCSLQVPIGFLSSSQHVPFKFPLGSYQVPNMFPSSSQWVLIRFSTCSLGSECVPQGCSQQHLPSIPYVLPKVLPFSPLYVGQRARHLIFPQNLLQFQLFFAMGQSNWLIGAKKKSWTFEAPPTN